MGIPGSMRRTTALGVIVVAAFAVGVVRASAAGGQSVPRNITAPSLAGDAREGGVLNVSAGRWKGDGRLGYTYQWRLCLADGSGCIDIGRATDRIYAARAADVGHTLRALVTAHGRGGVASAVSGATAVVAAQPAGVPRLSTQPTVGGTPKPGAILTASPGTWAETGPIVFSYRWRICDAAGGACKGAQQTATRARTYKVAAADARHTLRVLVTAANASGSTSALSDPSAAVTAPVVVLPQGPKASIAPRVSGTARQGQTLSGDRGQWTNSPTNYDYFWARCDAGGARCSDIGGARGATYTLTATDVGHTIRFEVQAKNSGGKTTALSAPTPLVAAIAKASPPANTSLPTVSGTAKEGSTLTGGRGQWSGNPNDYDYFWLRCSTGGGDCDEINGAHGLTYKLVGGDVGHTIRFKVKAKNPGGNTTARSAPTAVVRASDRPAGVSPPKISGTPVEGKTLVGDRGNWTHNPTAYEYSWFRCDRNGGSCAAIGGAHGTSYVLTSADVGATIRFTVIARNSAGASSSTSVPTAVILKATAPPPPPPQRGPGCPATGNPTQVGAISPPARLLVDALQSIPHTVSRTIDTLVLRFHVTSTCGGPVQGALVYATATPFNQFTVPSEQPTGSDGWATLVFRRLRGFPVSRRQQLIAVFVRARKPGESILGGISTRRLFSVPVVLR